jgi:hypothetical protein
MPLKREFFFRPFLCVSKNQILKLASSQQIPFREDPTNQSLKFQRNLLRKELIPPIKKNFPSLLKRYVQKQNEKLEILKKIKKPKQFIIPNSHVHLLGEAAVFELRQALHVLSKRGDWGEELKKVQLAQKNGKWGPMHLSHQIKVYLTPKHLLITQNHFDSKKSSYQKMTVKKLGENEKNYTKKDVKRLFYKYLSKANVHEFPFLVWIKNDKNSRVIKGDSIYNSMHLSKNHELHSPQWRIMPVSVLLSRWSDTDISLSLILPWGVE